MISRVYVEKKPKLAYEAKTLLSDLRTLLGIDTLTDVRILNRYDAEDMDPELFSYAQKVVFSEPKLDIVTRLPQFDGATVFAVEYLPGQFDQRADSAAQCIQIISHGERPLIRSAKVYALYGVLTENQLADIKKYVINPVEAREASLELPTTLKINCDIPQTVTTVEGFRKFSREQLGSFLTDNGLAMDIDDLIFCQKYFIQELRDPTITEIKLIDTYWSDHCRHTTFNTVIDYIKFEDNILQRCYDDYIATRKALGRKKPICLMDLGTLAAKWLRANGKLEKLDESEEINACTVKIEIEADGVKEPWLLLFKNETHNHPTEIEPFGGAATCVGGAIRDPLSGRSYVYGAMRITGAADPLTPISQTIPGKLPQRKIVTTAANGYSSYGNQIGLATGIVDEIYHPGYAAKRMEIGAVIAATPAENVRRERPTAGDAVILLGGNTGRDGIGGATGASKAHNAHSVETCGAEVQKGNAPEERKLQRLFRNPEASKLIKRCNDFGAGGVSVAIGELADGVEIDLDAVPRKYDGLDGTELAISESQERMAVVVEPSELEHFLDLAERENLSATKVATVTELPRLTMHWNGKKIVDLSREFLNSNGAEKHIKIETTAPKLKEKEISDSFIENLRNIATDLNCCSKRGLSERFDSTIGAGTVLMPFGGKFQRTPVQAMVHKISVEKKHTNDCSVMSWGYNPFISEQSPCHGAYLAVTESVCRLIASGADFNDIYLSFQEYFEKPGQDSKRWGKPLAALLGAFRAQKELGIAAIGGKDSMSGSFENLNVPPTLVSFAVTTQKTDDIVSPEFKTAGHRVIRLAPKYGTDGLPVAQSLLDTITRVTELLRSGHAVACWTPGIGGCAEGIVKMCMGNGFGFEFASALTQEEIFGYDYCAFLLEVTGDEETDKTFGKITNDRKIAHNGDSICLDEISTLYENKLEPVFTCNLKTQNMAAENFSYSTHFYPAPRVLFTHPKVIIPAFPGTNCEYDSAKAMADAGAKPEVIVINNLTATGIAKSVEYFAHQLETAQMLFIPGGFSGADEPDGSAKFITAFFRNEAVKEKVTQLLDERDGLICGICNGFQALIKLGLVPFGKIIDTDAYCPTLTYNTIARHQSKIVRTRIASNKSPWLSLTKTGEIYSCPISHGEGRFLAEDSLIKQMADNGQIATQYADLQDNATYDIQYNPNGSMLAIEGITSPDGRVFGKMGHSERKGLGLYKNVPGEYDMHMFEAAVRYFRG